MSNTFEYLNQWSKERLQKRLEVIKPLTEHLVQMFNAEHKMTAVELQYISDNRRTEHTEMLFSNFDPTNGNGFPDTLKNFLHDHTTFLCAEKMVIESLLNDIP